MRREGRTVRPKTTVDLTGDSLLYGYVTRRAAGPSIA